MKKLISSILIVGLLVSTVRADFGAAEIAREEASQKFEQLSTARMNASMKLSMASMWWVMVLAYNTEGWNDNDAVQYMILWYETLDAIDAGQDLYDEGEDYKGEGELANMDGIMEMMMARYDNAVSDFGSAVLEYNEAIIKYNAAYDKYQEAINNIDAMIDLYNAWNN